MSGMTTQNNEVRDIISDTINLANELVSSIITMIDNLSVQEFQKEYYRNIYLSDLTSDVTKLVEITTLLSKFLLSRKNISVPEIKNSHIHLLFIIKGINQNMQSNDHIVLDDLIKHELRDNLTQWKIELIPAIKRRMSL